MRLRFAVLGTGWMARQFALAVRTSAKVSCDVVASRTLATARATARATSIPRAIGEYRAAVEDPEVDAVYVALPNALHREWVDAALHAGKHVLCEKPLGINAGEVREMAARATASGLFLREGFLYRHQPQTIRAAELVRGGVLGSVRVIQASCAGHFDPPDVRFSSELGGGALLDLGCYPVSIARLLTGTRPQRVWASGSVHASGVDATVLAQLEHAGGAVAQIACSLDSAASRRTLIVGSAGTLEATFDNEGWPGEPLSLHVLRGTAWEERAREEQTPAVSAIQAQADAFSDLVRGVSQAWGLGLDLPESLDVALTLDAIARSVRHQQPIDVPCA